LIQGRSQEKWLKAKISQLDAQLYETQAAKEECSTIQTQLTEYEKEAAELRNRVDQADIDKVALSRRVADLEQERERLEKEVETTTEAATEANRMFEDLLNSQSETDELQHSVETLQQKLTQQQLAIETLTASLSIKAAENETLTKETDELRSETERYKVRVKTLQSDLEAMKTSNRNYQQKASQEGAELLKLKQEKDSWVSERRSLTGQVNSKTKEANEWRDKVENLKKAIKAKENDLAKSIELLKQSGGAASGIDSQAIIQLSSIVQLESDLAEANAKVEALVEEVKAHSEQAQQFEAEKQALRQELEQLQNSTQAAAKEKLEAETRLQV
jgi:chromosome segregation ATPase